jgi:hypothetical protein
MSPIATSLALALVCLGATGVGQTDPATHIPPFEARYVAHRAGIAVGEAVLQLEYEETNRYRMRSSLRLTGLASLVATESISEEVEGELVGGSPRPLCYQAERIGGKARTVTLTFAWDRGEVATRVNGEEGRLTLKGGAVDPLSLYLLTMLDLKRGALAEEYAVVDGKRLKTYATRDLGETTTGTPLGLFSTIRVTRQRPQSRKATTFWHAPELDFLPVELSRTKGGAELSRLTIDRLTR